MSWEPIDPKKPNENEIKHLIPPGALRNAVLATHMSISGAERRQKVAHGTSRGTEIKSSRSPGGA